MTMPYRLRLLLLALLFTVGPGSPAWGQAPADSGVSLPDAAGTGMLRERINTLRDENTRLRHRAADLRDRLTQLEARLPHLEEQVDTRLKALDQHLDDRSQSLESSLNLYMRVGTFVLILLGVFGFGYIHQILRGVIENAMSSHLRSDEFSRRLEAKVEQVAQEAREPILEASKEETRQLARRLIDEFLTEERSRIEQAVEEEQEALSNLRHEHLDLQTPVSDDTGRHLEKLASAVGGRSVELLTDEELYYAMLEADSKEAYAEAERYAREQGRRHPGEADSLANLAWILEHSGRTEEAEGHYRRALEADPTREDIARHYAYLLENLGRTEEGMQVLAAALEHNPDNPRVISHYAGFLMRAGDMESAEARLTAALERAPDHRGLLVTYARLLAQTDRLEEALATYDRAADAGAFDPEITRESADLALALDQLDRAKAETDALLENDPRSVPALNLQARVHLQQGAFAEAETDLRQALSNNGDRPDLRFRLAIALLGQGRRAEARELFSQAAREVSAETIAAYAVRPLEQLADRHTIPEADAFVQWLRTPASSEPGQREEE